MSLSIHQRLENMIRIGTIETIHPSKPFLTVTVNFGEITTAKIRYLNARSGDDQSWNPPSIGEEVIVFSPSGVLEIGIAFGGLNNADHPAISEDLNKNIMLFSDGCMISYDTQSHILEAILPELGTAVLNANGGVTVNANGGVTVNANEGLTINAVSGGTTHNGNFLLNGSQVTTGNSTVQGSQLVQGSSYSTGDFGTAGDVKAGDISLRDHKTSGIQAGEDTSGVPVP